VTDVRSPRPPQMRRPGNGCRGGPHRREPPVPARGEPGFKDPVAGPCHGGNSISTVTGRAIWRGTAASSVPCSSTRSTPIGTGNASWDDTTLRVSYQSPDLATHRWEGLGHGQGQAPRPSRPLTAARAAQGTPAVPIDDGDPFLFAVNVQGLVVPIAFPCAERRRDSVLCVGEPLLAALHRRPAWRSSRVRLESLTIAGLAASTLRRLSSRRV
jgi:hypothetical protein